MNELGAGVRMCSTAGMLQGAKYIAAAVYMNGAASQGSDLFQNGLNYLGRGLDVMSIISLIAGIILIATGTICTRRNKSNDSQRGEQK